MLIKWSDLQSGDVLAISKEALTIRASEHWTQDPYYINALFVVKKLEIMDDVICINVQDSDCKRSWWQARLNIANGALVSNPGHPLFEVVSLSEEE